MQEELSIVFEMFLRSPLKTRTEGGNREPRLKAIPRALAFSFFNYSNQFIRVIAALSEGKAFLTPLFTRAIVSAL